MSAAKRPVSETMEATAAAPSTSQVVPFKKSKTGELVQVAAGSREVVIAGILRTSNLQAPIMLLTGHESEIYTARFSPDGKFIASSGFDRKIFFWNVYGDCANLGVMQGHSGAITQLTFNTDGDILYTSSTDKTVGVWDVGYGLRLKRMKAHQSFVNSVDALRKDAPPLVCSGSDDGTIKVWDTRQRQPVKSLENSYQVLAVCFGASSEQLISGGIDNHIKVWDLRRDSVVYKLAGHQDTVTGLRLSGDGNLILSNSMDQTVRVWDIRPYAAANRCMGICHGAAHTPEQNLLRCCWSPDGRFVSAGSGNRLVNIWQTGTGQLIYQLPGHQGSVNETDFHPTEPIILSCGSDRRIYLGEIEL